MRHTNSCGAASTPTVAVPAMEDLHPCNTCGVLEHDDDKSDFWVACDSCDVPHARTLLMYLHLIPISVLIVVCEYCV